MSCPSFLGERQMQMAVGCEPNAVAALYAEKRDLTMATEGQADAFLDGDDQVGGGAARHAVTSAAGAATATAAAVEQVFD
jgi:hypothetical protein